MSEQKKDGGANEGADKDSAKKPGSATSDSKSTTAPAGNAAPAKSAQGDKPAAGASSKATAKSGVESRAESQAGKSSENAARSGKASTSKSAAGVGAASGAASSASSSGQSAGSAKPAGKPTGAKSSSAGGTKTGSSAASTHKTTAGGSQSATVSTGGRGTGTPRPASGAAGGGSSSGATKAIAIVAVIVAVVALALSGWVVYRGQAQLASVDSRLNTVEQGMQSSVQEVVKPRLSRLDSRLQSLNSDLGRLSERMDSRGNELSSVQESLQTTQTQLADLSDQITGSSNRVELNRIESLLRAANERLQLYNDPQGATRALDLASQAISRKNDPRLFDIRSEIANEIAALEALPSPDVEGLALQLAAMIDRVPELPLASDVPSEYASQGDAAAAEQAAGNGAAQVEGDTNGVSVEQFKAQFTQGWAHFTNSVGDALSGMLTIRRTDGTQTQRALLPPEQAFFLEQNLQLELRGARLALLEGDTPNYRDGLERARQWLADYYDTEASAVSSMRERLDRMSNVKLDWQAPDISSSLRQLRELMAQRANTGDGGESTGAAGGGASAANADNASTSGGDDSAQGGQ